MVDFYNAEVDRFARYVDEHRIAEPSEHVGEFIDTDPTKFSWNRADRLQITRGRKYQARPERLYVGNYRPFSKQAVWFDAELNDMVYRMPSLFPTPDHTNYGYVVVAPGSDKQFAAVAVGELPDLSMWGSGPSQFFARYTYEPIDDGTLDLDSDIVDGYRRIDNITDATLATYRTWYGSDVTKDDVFAFVYGLLHSDGYRERFAADLKRSLPRIPRIAADDFHAFRDAGQTLLDLHINYEDADPWPLTITGEPADPHSETAYEAYRVRKMTYAGTGREKDRTSITYSPRIIVSGIPEEAQRYMLGPRSALDWLIDRYQVRTDKASGIVNDPNDWAHEVGNPRYILDLIQKVTTVSVETVRLVDSLPRLRIQGEQS